MTKRKEILTADPTTDAFRRIQKGKQSPVGADTKNRRVVAPFTTDDRHAASSATRTRKSAEPLGGHGAETTRKTVEFYEKGLTDAERLRKRKRRAS